MQFLFWLSLALLFYIYFGYPLLAKVIAKIADREVQKSGSYEPTVSILIAAYNEANDIGATLRTYSGHIRTLFRPCLDNFGLFRTFSTNIGHFR